MYCVAEAITSEPTESFLRTVRENDDGEHNLGDEWSEAVIRLEQSAE
jgi:hypothetical protein